MRVVIPEPASLNRMHPVHRRARAVRSLNGLEGGPGPVLPREVTHAGNVSMHDHLQAIRQQAEAALDVAIVWSD